MKQIIQSNDELFKFKHGLKNHRLYDVWGKMKARCYNVTDKDYSDYGGRGIIVDSLWLVDFKSFYDWAMENGYKRGLEMDRKENSGNYEPDNCRFVTRSQNMRNTRRNHIIEYKGERKCLAEWAEITGHKRWTIFNRIHNCKWSVEEAFETPVIDRSIGNLPVYEIKQKINSGMSKLSIAKSYNVSSHSITRLLKKADI